MAMLEGKKLLITGVVNRESIAYEVARQAQEEGRRRGGAHLVRPRPADDRAVGDQAASASPTCSSSTSTAPRTSRPWRPSCASAGGASTACCTRSRSHPRMRSAATSSTRRCAERRGGVPDQRVLAEGAVGRARRSLPRGGGEHRRARLRQLGADLARIRLDGRGEGRARVGRPLPGARAGSPVDPRQPPQRGSRAHAAARGPGFRRARGRLAASGAARLGTGRRGARRLRLRGPALDLFPATTGETVRVDGGYHAMGTALTPVLQEATA